MKKKMKLKINIKLNNLDQYMQDNLYKDLQKFTFIKQLKYG